MVCLHGMVDFEYTTQNGGGTRAYVVYDGIPCWNMIGQKEDRLLYPNTGQAFNIDTISQETSRLAS